jgi:hypothetical protein
MTTSSILKLHRAVGTPRLFGGASPAHRVLPACDGIVTDQAALRGHLRKVRDIGLPVVSVTSAIPDQPDAPTLAPHQVPTTPPRRTT